VADVPEIPPDFFERLGLKRSGCTDEQVKIAYRRLAGEFHPDNGRTPDVDWFIAITEAKDALATTAGREEYIVKETADGFSDGDFGTFDPPSGTPRPDVAPHAQYSVISIPRKWSELHAGDKRLLVMGSLVSGALVTMLVLAWRAVIGIMHAAAMLTGHNLIAEIVVAAIVIVVSVWRGYPVSFEIIGLAGRYIYLVAVVGWWTGRLLVGITRRIWAVRPWRKPLCIYATHPIFNRGPAIWRGLLSVSTQLASFTAARVVAVTKDDLIYCPPYHHLLAWARSTHSLTIFQAWSGPVIPRTTVPPFLRSL
jgi:hypothetical protein